MTENRNETSDMFSGRVNLSDWVQKALDHAGMTQAELSRALIQAGLRTIDRSAVNKILLGTRKLLAEEMLEISRITDYPITDRRIGRPKQDEQSSGQIIESRQDHKKIDEQRERRLQSLISKVLEAHGMTADAAERLAAAIARVADMPPNTRDGEIGPDQIKREARILAALFDPKHPL
jgi:transcriptional regulator with XRE-family HTH domain